MFDKNAYYIIKCVGEVYYASGSDIKIDNCILKISKALRCRSKTYRIANGPYSDPLIGRVYYAELSRNVMIGAGAGHYEARTRTSLPPWVFHSAEWASRTIRKGNSHADIQEKAKYKNCSKKLQV